MPFLTSRVGTIEQNAKSEDILAKKILLKKPSHKLSLLYDLQGGASLVGA
jgi:hypothetical protein